MIFRKRDDSVCIHPNTFGASAHLSLLGKIFFTLVINPYLVNVPILHSLMKPPENLSVELFYSFNPFLAKIFPFYTPWKHPEKGFREYKMAIFCPEMGWSNRRVLILARTRNKNISTFLKHRPFLLGFSEQKCLTSPSKHLLFLSQR